MLVAVYSNKRSAWGVGNQEPYSRVRIIWECKSQAGAEKLAEEINTGAVICRGSSFFDSNCGNCVKCELTVEN